MRKSWRKILSFLAAVLICSGLLLTSARAADFAMIVKSGTVQLWDDDQRLDLADRRFDDNSRRTLAVAWEVRNAKEVALGMEYLTFKHDFSPPTSGRTKTQVWLFNAKKYFSPNRVLHPFVGLGLGWGYAKYDDNFGNVDRDANVALQATTGVEFRIGENVGFYTELRGLASGTDGEEENEFDFSGTGFLAGISLIF